MSDIATHACNPIRGKVEAEGSIDEGHPQLHSEFRAVPRFYVVHETLSQKQTNKTASLHICDQCTVGSCKQNCYLRSVYITNYTWYNLMKRDVRLGNNRKVYFCYFYIWPKHSKWENSAFVTMNLSPWPDLTFLLYKKLMKLHNWTLLCFLSSFLFSSLPSILTHFHAPSLPCCGR